jgi:hypothetical protein
MRALHALTAVLATVVTALMMSAGAIAFSPAKVADASEASCAGGANGFIDISDSLTGTNAPVGRNPLNNIDNFGVKLALEFGTVSGAQRGWAHLSGSLVPNDEVWMNWRWISHGIHVQCGPFKAAGKISKTSAAKATNSATDYNFQACALLVGDPNAHCTDWW